MTDTADVAIVGGGIVGLAHAWVAARNGRSVIVFEKDIRPLGASIRNFGMIWPIGQPQGRLHELALASRSHWVRLAREGGFWLSECGSVHLAHRQDEQRVLEEFRELAPSFGYDCQMLTAGEVQKKTDAANATGLLGGLWSPTELCVDPRQVMRVLPKWLEEVHNVQFRFGSTVHRVENGQLTTADGRRIRAERVIVASGSDFETLFPNVFADSGMTRCKLQMMRTLPQPGEWRMGPHLAGGLTLRHYKAFTICPSLDALKRRIAEETPLLDRFGIHVMAAQNRAGEVVLGDSHEYGSVVDPVCNDEIDDSILRELRRIIQLKDWSIAQRWYGVYAKHPTDPIFEHDVADGVKILTGIGGAGMTLSFGLAEETWKAWH